jgi:hypothetical protein
MAQQFSDEKIASWHALVGKKVWKNPKTTTKSEPKPFKSGLKFNTVKAVVIHDHTPHLAFSFVEDTSQVECFRCSLAPEGRYPEGN